MSEICAQYPLYDMPDDEKEKLINRIRRKLGAPVMGVELSDEQIEECISEAIEEYSTKINEWALENRMAEMLGLPKTIDFTLKYVANSLYFEKSFAKNPSELIGGGINTTRELKMDQITLTAGTQDYHIPADREINEVMWYTPSFINLYGLDPFANSNIAFHEFGASFAGHTLYHVMPVFDTLLTAQAAKLRNKVRGSEYSYKIFKGPPGQRVVRFYPIPRNAAGLNRGSGTYYGLGRGGGTPGTVFYRYYENVGAAGNPEYSGSSYGGYSAQTGEQGNGLVSGPSDAKLFYLKYTDLNDVAKTWVKKFAQAQAKELLGLGIRGKFGGQLPIPDAELTLNADDLISNGRADQERYLEQLDSTLEKLSLKNILNDRAEMAQSVNTSLKSKPLGIYWG